MNIERVERSYDQCAESGWFGYYIHLARPVGPALVEALAPLGQLTYMKSMKRPFFSVRGADFLVRGITGDGFVKAGLAQKDAPALEQVKRVIEEAHL